MSKRKIGVVGAGQMGARTAQVAAQAGLGVLLHDVSDEVLKKSLDGIARNVDRMIARGRIKPEQRDAILRRMETSSRLEDLADTDFVIEAILENEDAKIELLKKLDQVCPPPVIFASNTSSISITKMSARTSRADRV